MYLLIQSDELLNSDEVTMPFCSVHLIKDDAHPQGHTKDSQTSLGTGTKLSKLLYKHQQPELAEMMPDICESWRQHNIENW